MLPFGSNFQNGSASPWSENYADQDNKTLDYNVAIDTLQDWLKEKYATLPKFDHAMAFTGFVYEDLYTLPQSLTSTIV